MWSLRQGFADSHDSRLVLTFVGETRILEINAEDELDESEVPGFDALAQVDTPPHKTLNSKPYTLQRVRGCDPMTPCATCNALCIVQCIVQSFSAAASPPGSPAHCSAVAS